MSRTQPGVRGSSWPSRCRTEILGVQSGLGRRRTYRRRRRCGRTQCPRPDSVPRVSESDATWPHHAQQRHAAREAACISSATTAEVRDCRTKRTTVAKLTGYANARCLIFSWHISPANAAVGAEWTRCTFAQYAQARVGRPGPLKRGFVVRSYEYMPPV